MPPYRTIEVIDQIWNQRFAVDNFYRSQKNWIGLLRSGFGLKWT